MVEILGYMMVKGCSEPASTDGERMVNGETMTDGFMVMANKF